MALQLPKACLLFFNPDFFHLQYLLLFSVFMSFMNLVSMSLPVICTSKSYVLKRIETICTFSIPKELIRTDIPLK